MFIMTKTWEGAQLSNSWGIIQANSVTLTESRQVCMLDLCQMPEILASTWKDVLEVGLHEQQIENSLYPLKTMQNEQLQEQENTVVFKWSFFFL